MKKLILTSICLSLILIIFNSCNDEVIIPNEEELITTLLFTLAPSGGGAPIVLSFTDLDGDGGNVPIVVAPPISANTSYIGNLQLLNETVSPAENITTEIADEDEDHQFFFESTVSGLSINYSDMDSLGNPIGIQTSVTTHDVGNGILTITLRHQPDKFATGVSNGNITNAGGETDIEVTFNVVVQ